MNDRSILQQMPQLPRLHYWQLIQGTDRIYYLRICEAKRMVGRKTRGGGVLVSEPVLMHVRGAPVPWDMYSGVDTVLQLAHTMAETVDLL